MSIHGIDAVVFDMDGTLVDSEGLTERAIETLLRRHGVEGGLPDPARFHGQTWSAIAAELRRARSIPLDRQAIAAELQAEFHVLLSEERPREVPGARGAFLAAAESFRAAVATSSNRQSAELVLDRLELRGACAVMVCAEDTERSKPDPQCYLVAAKRLGVEADRCLVFEDSLAGLEAARGAGAWVVAITRGTDDARRRRASELAHRTVPDFTALGADFFRGLAEGASR